MTRLAAVMVAAVLAGSIVLPARPDVPPSCASSSEHRAGMGAPAGPVVSAFVVTSPVVLGGSPSVTPNAVAASRLAVGDRLPETRVRVAVVVQPAPTILRV
jgi:hypothetical protein